MIQTEQEWCSKASTAGYQATLDAERALRKGLEERDGYRYERGDYADPTVQARSAAARKGARIATLWVRAAGSGCSFEAAA